MSIFKKIKQGLGIGTAKVELQSPASISKDAGELTGKVIVIAKSDQKVKSIKISLVEKSVVGSGETREERTKVIESLVLDESFEIKKDEEKTIDFTLPLHGSGDSASLKIFGGTLTISGGESSTSKNLQVVATVDLEGVALDPTASNDIYFT